MSERKVGRPRKFQEEYIEQARKLCELGATDLQLANFFNVVESTLHKWKHDFPAFSDAIKEGKVSIDDAVEKSLLNRAMGMTLEEWKEEESDNGVKKTHTKKQIAGDTTAQIFWLKNRRPDKWRDKQQVDTNLVIKKVEDSEW